MKQLDSKTLQYIAHAYGRNYAEGDEVAPINPPPEDQMADATPIQLGAGDYDPQAAKLQFLEDPRNKGAYKEAVAKEAGLNLEAKDINNLLPQQIQPTEPKVVLPANENHVNPKDINNPYAGAYKAQQAANLEMAKAEKNLGTEQQGYSNTALGDIKKLPTEQDLFNNHKTKDDALIQAYQDKKLDPNRYLNSMSTGQKLLSGIALILGGAGGGASGQPNLAANMMNNAIERDIDSQKNDQSQALNLWKLNKEEYGDEISANLATKNQILAGLQVQLNSAAQGAKGSIALANAHGLNAQIQQEMNRNNMMLTLNSSLNGKTEEGSDEASFSKTLSAARIIAPKMAEEAEKHYIPSVGRTRISMTPQDRDSVVALTDLNQNIDKALDLQGKFGLTGAWTPTTRAQANEIQSELNVSLNQLFNLKRLTPIEYDNFKNQIGHIGGVNFGGTLEGLKSLKDNANSKQGVLYDQLGVTPFKHPNTQNEQARPPISGKPNSVSQNGHVYHLNPTSGKYE